MTNKVPQVAQDRAKQIGVRFMLGGSDVAFMMEAGSRRAFFLSTLHPRGAGGGEQ
jgi:hypothetical protein